MIAWLTTWTDLGPLRDDVLFIINSPDDNEGEVDLTFERVQSCCSARLYVIARARWQPWLQRRHLPDDRLLLVTTDGSGQELELNYFLEGPLALNWVRTNRLGITIGSSPHNLYNEEVKDIFEQRVCLFLGTGLFIAHALPEPYVYVFDLGHLLQRIGRRVRTDRYLVDCRAMLSDWYRLWQARGRPIVSDDSDFDAVIDVLRQRVGADMLAFDERSSIVPLHSNGSGALSAFVMHLRDVVLERDRMCAELKAVTLRRHIIDKVRRELDMTLDWLGRWRTRGTDRS